MLHIFKFSIIFFIFCFSFSNILAQGIEESLIVKSKEIVNLLDKADFKSLSSYIHEDRGLQFSPYDQAPLTESKPKKTPLSAPNVTKFSKKQIRGFFEDEKKYVWGNWDGSGEQIKFNSKEYFKEFVYDFDYKEKTKPFYIPNKKTKEWKIKWREVKFVYKAYPKSEIIQFEYKGTPEAAFNDFKKLTLVFEQIENNWWLIAIVHGEKTI